MLEEHTMQVVRAVLVLTAATLLTPAGLKFRSLTYAAADEAQSFGSQAAAHPAGSWGVWGKYVPRLPSDIAAWRYYLQSGADAGATKAESREPVPELSQRYWEPHHLGDAIWSSGMAQFKSLLDRLQRGDPIQVVSWGSSITQDHGGCFHPSIQHAAELVQQLPRTLRYSGRSCGFIKNGWLQSFMQLVNATWPHANHTLLNDGRGGATLAVNVQGTCYEDSVPSRVDLWLLENMDGRTQPGSLEEVLWAILRRAAAAGQPRPAIVILNSACIAAPVAGSPALECTRNRTLCATLCPDNPASPQTGFLASAVAGGEYRTRNGGFPHAAAQLGNYYGVTVLSHMQFYQALLRDGFHTRRNWSQCDLLTIAQMDEIHPNSLGRVLLADYLVNVLRLAEQHAAEMPHVGPPGLPARPLFAEGHSAPLSRCFLSDVGGAVSPAGNYTARLQVLRNEGWAFIEYYNNSQGRLLYKPGYYASTPGAVFEMRVDATWPAGQAREGGKRVLVSYLKSWDRMGVVELSCGGGCRCNSSLLDGRHAEHNSVQHTLVVALTAVSEVPGDDCTLRFVAQLNGGGGGAGSGGGGHRFKLISVMVTADPATQGTVAFPPWTGFSEPPAGG